MRASRRPRTDPEALDVLLSSEVGTEGLDYQFCDALVNYDLPWNPMRIEQRIGRIDRRGQASETVAIKNLVVSGTVDAVIFERCLERIGVFNRALGGSEAILGDLTRDIRKIAEDLTLTIAEREARLQQLADNRIGRIQEQEELEERESALFGLPLRKLDEEGVEQAASPWLAPEQLGTSRPALPVQPVATTGRDAVRAPCRPVPPGKEIRASLRDDLLAAAPESTSQWRRWLESGSDHSRRLTFDAALASDGDIELLSPVHDLVRIAAANEETVRARQHRLPPGAVGLGTGRHLSGRRFIRGPISGARDDFEVVRDRDYRWLSRRVRAHSGWPPSTRTSSSAELIASAG